MIDELIAELAQRPEDVELVRVFADWLLQQGHPIGELAVVQLERAAHDSEALANREYDLIWNHANPYATKLLERAAVTEYVWRGGLLDVITLHHQGGEEQLEDVFARLATDPVMRLVRCVEIEAVEFDGTGDLAPAIRALAALAPALPRLSELVIREGTNLGNPWIDGPIHVGDVTPLYAAYPQLRVLELGGKEYELGDLALPALEKLVLADIRPADVATVARGQLPALSQLELFFGRWRVDGIDAVFRPLFDRAMPNLAVVGVGAEIPQVMQYLVRALPASELARHARVIAFPRGALDDDCVRTLVQWAPRLRTLDRLEVEGRGLAAHNLRSLHAAFGRILVVR